MSFHYLQEPGGAFSLDAYLAGIRSARLKSSHQPGKCCSPDNGTEASPISQSGMTSAPLTEDHGEAMSISSPAASPARIFPVREKGKASAGLVPDCGLRCTESFARFDRVSCSWRTPQCSLLEGLDVFSETWPKAGIMRHGVCWELPTWVLPTGGTASGFSPRFPTPQASDLKRAKYTPEGLLTRMKSHQEGLPEVVFYRLYFPTPTCQDAKNNGGASQMKRNTPPLNAVAGGALSPTWVEWLMGWPLGWTDCEPLAMGRYHSWLQRHSASLEKLSKD